MAAVHRRHQPPIDNGWAEARLHRVVSVLQLGHRRGVRVDDDMLPCGAVPQQRSTLRQRSQAPSRPLLRSRGGVGDSRHAAQRRHHPRVERAVHDVLQANDDACLRQIVCKRPSRDKASASHVLAAAARVVEAALPVLTQGRHVLHQHVPERGVRVREQDAQRHLAVPVCAPSSKKKTKKTQRSCCTYTSRAWGRASRSRRCRR